MDVDLAGDRKPTSSTACSMASLEENDAQKVLQHVADLWGYDVKLSEADESGNVGGTFAQPWRVFAVSARGTRLCCRPSHRRWLR